MVDILRFQYDSSLWQPILSNVRPVLTCCQWLSLCPWLYCSLWTKICRYLTTQFGISCDNAQVFWYNSYVKENLGNNAYLFSFISISLVIIIIYKVKVNTCLFQSLISIFLLSLYVYIIVWIVIIFLHISCSMSH